jgi:hypothetical protein
MRVLNQVALEIGLLSRSEVIARDIARVELGLEGPARNAGAESELSDGAGAA